LTTKAGQSSLPQPSVTLGDAQSTGGNSNGAKKVGIGAAIGGVLGGIAILVLIVFLVWWTKKRKIAHRQWQKESIPSNDAGGMRDMNTTGTMGPHSGLGVTGMAGVGAGAYQGHDDVYSQAAHARSGSTDYSLGTHSTPISNSEALRETSLGPSSTGAVGIGMTMMDPSTTVSRQVGTPQTLPLYTSPMGDTPPIYRSAGTHYIPLQRTPIPAIPGQVTLGNGNNGADTVSFGNSYYETSPNSNSNSLSIYTDDPIGIWAQEHRSVISPDFERRLRTAGYSPEFDPDTMSEETWLNRYGVSPFELQTLRRLHLRRR
jgi:hypothetical protein